CVPESGPQAFAEPLRLRPFSCRIAEMVAARQPAGLSCHEPGMIVRLRVRGVYLPVTAWDPDTSPDWKRRLPRNNAPSASSSRSKLTSSPRHEIDPCHWPTTSLPPLSTLADTGVCATACDAATEMAKAIARLLNILN